MFHAQQGSCRVGWLLLSKNLPFKCLKCFGTVSFCCLLKSFTEPVLLFWNDWRLWSCPGAAVLKRLMPISLGLFHASPELWGLCSNISCYLCVSALWIFLHVDFLFISLVSVLLKGSGGSDDRHHQVSSLPLSGDMLRWWDGTGFWMCSCCESVILCSCSRRETWQIKQRGLTTGSAQWTVDAASDTWTNSLRVIVCFFINDDVTRNTTQTLTKSTFKHQHLGFLLIFSPQFWDLEQTASHQSHWRLWCYFVCVGSATHTSGQKRPQLLWKRPETTKLDLDYEWKPKKQGASSITSNH